MCLTSVQSLVQLNPTHSKVFSKFEYFQFFSLDNKIDNKTVCLCGIHANDYFMFEITLLHGF